jgi:hypothetical protein
MEEVLKKIDEEIDRIRNIISDGASTQKNYWELKGQLEMAVKLKEMISLNYISKPLTIGDKIRESNESLTEFILKVTNSCVYNDCHKCTIRMQEEGCNKTTVLHYLDQLAAKQ